MTVTTRRKRRVASDEAHAWARNLRLKNLAARVVLQALTLYVDGDGVCFVSLQALAEDTELSRNTVRNRLEWLEGIGAVARFPAWLDEHGVRNRQGRGKRTTDEIKLMLDDEDVIEARAAGTAEVAGGVTEHVISGPRGGPLDYTSEEVSRPLAVQQESNCVDGLNPSEPEPEHPSYLPSGGTSEAMPEALKRVIDSGPWDGVVTNLPLAITLWNAQGPQAQADIELAAVGYKRFLDKENGPRRPERRRPPKDFHTWVRSGRWLGYVAAGKAAEVIAGRCDVREDSPQWKAWDVFYTICGRGGIPEIYTSGAAGARLANVPSEWPPKVGGVDSDRSQWVEVTQAEGAAGGPYWAWLRRLREVPNVLITTPNGRGLRVPTMWPPAKREGAGELPPVAESG